MIAAGIVATLAPGNAQASNECPRCDAVLVDLEDGGRDPRLVRNTGVEPAGNPDLCLPGCLGVDQGRPGVLKRKLQRRDGERHGKFRRVAKTKGQDRLMGIQLDEAGLPILLAQALRERSALDGLDVGPMVCKAAGYIARNGPVTQQDRWEENAGLSPFTLAVEIAALVCAAGFLEEPAQSYALELADTWNARIEDWTYVADTELAHRIGVEGYYVRIAPPEVGGVQVLSGRTSRSRTGRRKTPNG